MFLFLSKHWGFVVLGVTAVLLAAFRLLPSMGSSHAPVVVPTCDDPVFSRIHGPMIRGLAIGPGGSLYTRHYDHTVRKWSREGQNLWEIPFATLPDLTPLSVNDLTVAEDGTVSVLGVTASHPPQTAIYQVLDQEGVPRVVEFARIPESEGASLTASADRTLLVFGIELAEVHRLCLAAREGSQIEPPDLPLLHEFGPDGRLMRSFGSHRFSARTVEDLTRELTDLLETRVVAGPRGDIYLWHPFRVVLEAVDRQTGDPVGRIPLPYSGVREAQIWGVNFAGESRLIYTVVFSPPIGSVSGYEVRTLDLPTGRSEVLDRSDESMVVEGLWDTDRRRVALIHKSGGIGGPGAVPAVRYQELDSASEVRIP
jgi:hypothetical protein